MSIEKPSESERVEDIEKARTMAEASDPYRTLAATERAKSGETRSSKIYDANAELAEDKVEINYEIQKSAENLTDKEVEFMANSKARILNETKQHLSETKKAFTKNPSELLVEELNNVVAETNKLTRESAAWNQVNINRKNKSQ